MLYFRRSPLLRRVILPLTLLAFLSACHKWVPLEPPVAQAVAEEEPGTVRVTLADNSRIDLEEPRVSGDSLVALDGTARVALDDVQQIEARRANVPATVVLIAVPVVLALVGLFAVAVCADGACSGGS
jgi:hypothetical protein